MKASQQLRRDRIAGADGADRDHLGIDASGNPIMTSGNNGNRVREAPVSRGRIYAYVMPTS